MHFSILLAASGRQRSMISISLVIGALHIRMAWTFTPQKRSICVDNDWKMKETKFFARHCTWNLLVHKMSTIRLLLFLNFRFTNQTHNHQIVFTNKMIMVRRAENRKKKKTNWLSIVRCCNLRVCSSAGASRHVRCDNTNMRQFNNNEKSHRSAKWSI